MKYQARRYGIFMANKFKDLRGYEWKRDFSRASDYEARKQSRVSIENNKLSVLQK